MIIFNKLNIFIELIKYEYLKINGFGVLKKT